MNRRIILLILTLTLLLCFGCGKKKESKLSISLHLFDGSVSVVEASKGEKISDAKEVSGYDFIGWYKDEACTNKLEGNIVNESMHLYARYDKYYNITVHILDNVEVFKLYEFDYVYNINIEEPAGYTFTGLFEDQNHRIRISRDELVLSDLEVYAFMEAKYYTITFETNGGSNILSQKVNENECVKKPGDPAKLYGEFVGWYTDIELNNEYNFNNAVTSAFTLYAKYNECSYEGLLDEYVPSIITSNLDLPTGTDNLSYDWSSTDDTIFSTLGKVNPARTDTTLTVTLNVRARGVSDSATYTKQVTVKGYTLPELVAGDVKIGFSSTWYYSGYSEELLKTMNIVNLAFGYINANGTVDISSVKSLATSVVGTLHQNGIRVSISYQGYGATTQNFSDCAADPTLRHKLAVSMADTVKNLHLDGVDIDWEYPGSASRQFTEDKVNYVLLMREIRAELDKLGEGYILTAAIPGGTNIGGFDMPNLVDCFDYFTMMSYDLESPNSGGHHTALHPSTQYGTNTGNSASESVELWHNNGVPYEKICIGIAFYGKKVKLTSLSNHGLAIPVYAGGAYKNSKYSVLMDYNLQYLGKNDKFVYYFDESSCAPIINDPAMYITTYDNERSIIDKCEYARSKGLAGVMIWELGEDDTTTLVTAVAQGMDDHLDGKYYIVEGHQTIEKGSQITIQAINEVVNSALASTLVYELDNESLATLNGNKLTLNNTGTLTVTAKSTSGTVYGVLVIEIV